jgi:hypothetical protein
MITDFTRDNHWHLLPHTRPFVLEHDLPSICRFNQKVESRFQYVLDLHPEPFIGSLSAPVILLALNPGLSERDYLVHADEHLLGTIRNSAVQSPLCNQFYYLSESFSSTPGGEWWRSKLRCLIDDLGVEPVSAAICCIQLYPYHSREFHSIPEETSTVLHVRQVLLDQFRLGKQIIVMRAWRQWTSLVPELHDYERVFRLRNPRNPCLSPGNLGDSYEMVREAMLTGPNSG